MWTSDFGFPVVNLVLPPGPLLDPESSGRILPSQCNLKIVMLNYRCLLPSTARFPLLQFASNSAAENTDEHSHI